MFDADLTTLELNSPLNSILYSNSFENMQNSLPKGTVQIMSRVLSYSGVLALDIMTGTISFL